MVNARGIAAVALLVVSTVAWPQAKSLAVGELAWPTRTTELNDKPVNGRPNGQHVTPAARVKLLQAGRLGSALWWRVDADGKTGWIKDEYLAHPMDEAMQRATAPLRFSTPSDAKAEDRSAELNHYWDAIRSHDMEARTRACQTLPYSGHTDPQFFEALDAWLRARLNAAAAADEDVESDVTRCVQALATSGNPKYAETLDLWFRSPQMGRGGKRMIRRSKELLAQSSLWNEHINRTDTHGPDRTWKQTRALNMIRSGDAGLQREGLRRIARFRTEYAPLFPDVEAVLLSVAKDPAREDITAWSCKTLALSGNPRYEATLAKVAAEATSSNLKRHCGDAIETLRDPPPEEVGEEVEEDA